MNITYIQNFTPPIEQFQITIPHGSEVVLVDTCRSFCFSHIHLYYIVLPIVYAMINYFISRYGSNKLKDNFWIIHLCVLTIYVLSILVNYYYISL